MFGETFIFYHAIKVEEETSFGMLYYEYSKKLKEVLDNHINFCGNIEMTEDTPTIAYRYSDEHRSFGHVYIKAFLRLKSIEA